LNRNIVWHEANVHKEERKKLNGHGSCIIWFTGLSGSGKSTLSHALDEALYQRQARSYVLDGDNIRHGLNKDLGFSDEARTENIRRIGEVAKLFIDAGLIVMTAFISPFRKDRDIVREIVQEGEFIEIFVKCPLAVCENRDPKGLYKKARNGEIKQFTGIDSPYEEPVNPEFVIETDKMSVDEAVKSILNYLVTKGVLND